MFAKARIATLISNAKRLDRKKKIILGIGLGLLTTVMFLSNLSGESTSPVCVHELSLLQKPATFATNPVRTNADTRKNRTLELVKAARNNRYSACQNRKQLIDKDIASVANGLNAGTFATEVLGLNGTLQMFQTTSAFDSWVTDKFTTEVIKSDDLLKIIKIHFNKLKGDLHEIDSELLRSINMSHDHLLTTADDFAAAGAEVQSTIQTAIGRSKPYIRSAPAEMAGSLVASYIVGSIASAAAESLGGKTSDGKPTQSNQRIAAGASLVAGYGADVATKEILGTERKLKSDVESTIREGLQRIRLSGSRSQLWTSKLDNLVVEDQTQIESIIANKAGLNQSDLD